MFHVSHTPNYQYECQPAFLTSPTESGNFALPSVHCIFRTLLSGNQQSASPQLQRNCNSEDARNLYTNVCFFTLLLLKKGNRNPFPLLTYQLRKMLPIKFLFV